MRIPPILFLLLAVLTVCSAEPRRLQGPGDSASVDATPDEDDSRARRLGRVSRQLAPCNSKHPRWPRCKNDPSDSVDVDNIPAPSAESESESEDETSIKIVGSSDDRKKKNKKKDVDSNDLLKQDPEMEKYRNTFRQRSKRAFRSARDAMKQGIKDSNFGNRLGNGIGNKLKPKYTKMMEGRKRMANLAGDPAKNKAFLDKMEREFPNDPVVQQMVWDIKKQEGIAKEKKRKFDKMGKGVVANGWDVRDATNEYVDEMKKLKKLYKDLDQQWHAAASIANPERKRVNKLRDSNDRKYLKKKQDAVNAEVGAKIRPLKAQQEKQQAVNQELRKHKKKLDAKERKRQQQYEDANKLKRENELKNDMIAIQEKKVQKAKEQKVKLNKKIQDTVTEVIADQDIAGTVGAELNKVLKKKLENFYADEGQQDLIKANDAMEKRKDEEMAFRKEIADHLAKPATNDGDADGEAADGSNVAKKNVGNNDDSGKDKNENDNENNQNLDGYTEGGPQDAEVMNGNSAFANQLANDAAAEAAMFDDINAHMDTPEGGRK